jgi:hypothetical protein
MIIVIFFSNLIFKSSTALLNIDFCVLYSIIANAEIMKIYVRCTNIFLIINAFIIKKIETIFVFMLLNSSYIIFDC